MTTPLGPRSFSGGAPATELTAPIGTGDLVLDVSAITTADWPDTTWGSFIVVLDRGNGVLEEQVLVSAYTSTTMTVPAGGRGKNKTTAQDHEVGCTVQHIPDAGSMLDMNEHVYDSTRNDHAQYPFFTPSVSGAPASGTWATNAIVVDDQGQFWKCTAGGTPGTWAEINVSGASSYPIGAIFLSAVSTNPATLLGFGTWSAIGQGRVLMGVGTGTDIHSNTLAVAEGAGGDSIGEYKHTLTGAESGTPVHGHGVTDPDHVHGSASNNGGFLADGLNGMGTGYTGAASGTGANWSTPATGAAATGLTVNNAAAANASSAHNLVEPYFGIYVWQRTA